MVRSLGAGAPAAHLSCPACIHDGEGAAPRRALGRSLEPARGCSLERARLRESKAQACTKHGSTAHGSAAARACTTRSTVCCAGANRHARRRARGAAIARDSEYPQWVAEPRVGARGAPTPTNIDWYVLLLDDFSSFRMRFSGFLFHSPVQIIKRCGFVVYPTNGRTPRTNQYLSRHFPVRKFCTTRCIQKCILTCANRANRFQIASFPLYSRLQFCTRYAWVPVLSKKVVSRRSWSAPRPAPTGNLWCGKK